MMALKFFGLIAAILHVDASRYAGVSVQLFEWSWSDVAVECETFLSVKGYRAVQVSPPTDHVQGTQWWTRYQPVSYKIISRSGNETQFDDMVQRCTKVGVQVIVDSVINHMAAGSGKSISGASYGSRQYPSYSPNDFHHDSNNVYTNCQVSNYYDKRNVQYCDLSGLPDLMTSSSYVQGQIVGYLKGLYNKGVRGLRIDAAKHQDASELSGILRALPTDMYVGQEVIGAAGEAVQPSMYFGLGQVSEFYYADYLDPNIINENKMIYLQTFGEAWGLMPDYNAVGFLDK
jgi:alpha-amylase